MVSSHCVYGNYNDKTYEVIRYYNVVSKMLVLKLLIILFPQKGNGILLLCGFILAIIIPFPQKGNGILLLCGFILAIIIIRAVVVVVVKVVNVGQISIFF